MFSSVLIANRGEIACRIARTARRLGLRTIAVYSDADARALHVQLCDEAHRIGPAPAADSYLASDKIIAAARRAEAECIHPGYGFLAENASFAEECRQAGFAFVGPPAQAIRAMGLKDQAKKLMEQAGVPVVPGYHGERQDPRFLKEKAYQIGYPVLIKAVAGGGGKGMRRVDRHADFDAALESARREAASAFGDDRVMLEKYIASARHIEIQLFADAHGHTIHLNERDCSLQRRHQKVIEEAPAPGMPAAVRAAMGAAAVRAAVAVGYVGAGTVEFIADAMGDLRPDGFWFMEMNTRLQVEHPVTEAITGFDLVEWQLRIAAGQPLRVAQEDVRISGHAVEARLYAEDPEREFLPSTGRLVALELPAGDGIRVDSGVAAGGEITSYYDPMIAKIIAHGGSREQALDRLSAALERTLVAGPRTNVALLAALSGAVDFRHGRFDTGFIDRNAAALGAAPHGVDKRAAAAGIQRLVEQGIGRPEPRPEHSGWTTPWAATDAFQLSGARHLPMPARVENQMMQARVRFDGKTVAVDLDDASPADDATVIEDDAQVFVLRAGRQTVVRRADYDGADLDQADGEGTVRAPMHGKVLALLVDVGTEVLRGQHIAIIEAMKMEHAVVAPCAGVVAEIVAAAGAQVAERAAIMRIARTDDAP